IARARLLRDAARHADPVDVRRALVDRVGARARARHRRRRRSRGPDGAGPGRPRGPRRVGVPRRRRRGARSHGRAARRRRPRRRELPRGRNMTALRKRRAPPRDVADRVAAVDWAGVSEELDAQGCAVVPAVLTRAECRDLAALYPRDELFRSRIVMAEHGFGRGEYKYFAYPLPDLVAELRATFYPRLAPIGNRWNAAMGIDVADPSARPRFLERCHAAGQVRPTPLMLAYGEDDYNCLHQDLYGEHVFPLQLAVLLSEPERDFTGGELVMTEQRPRMQSRPIVVPLRQGD